MRRAIPLLLALAALALGVAADAPAPMTNEDVVKLVSAGTSVDDILDAVRTKPAAFDVSEDRLAELRLAGVREAVISAMVARAEAAEPKPAAERPPRNTVHVSVALSGSKALKAPEWANEDVKARLHLPKELDARRIHDLAIFLACMTAVHAPDQWRSKTPLGRDTYGTPRHQMLRFVAGDTAEGHPPRLALPATIDADVEDVEPHDLTLGVAARIGDRWYAVAVSPPLKIDPGKLPETLVGKIEQESGSLAMTAFLATSKAGLKPSPTPKPSPRPSPRP